MAAIVPVIDLAGVGMRNEVRLWVIAEICLNWLPIRVRAADMAIILKQPSCGVAKRGMTAEHVKKRMLWRCPLAGHSYTKRGGQKRCWDGQSRTSRFQSVRPDSEYF